MFLVRIWTAAHCLCIHYLSVKAVFIAVLEAFDKAVDAMLGCTSCKLGAQPVVAVHAPHRQHFLASLLCNQSVTISQSRVSSSRRKFTVTVNELQDVNFVRSLMQRHVRHTGSPLAKPLLSDWESAQLHLVKIHPHNPVQATDPVFLWCRMSAWCAA